MLPASLLAAIEAHTCTSGCYAHEIPVAMCIDPARAPVTSYHISCQDCLMFHVGSLASILPAGTTQYSLAQEAAAHMRTVRGYKWAFSGYHATGPGFWLSAAYFGDGLFLVDGSRNHGGALDIDLLVQAFRARLASPDDPGMLTPSNYAVEVVHLDCSAGKVWTSVPKCKADIIRLQGCSLAPRQGHRRVAIVEFLPMVNGTQVSAPNVPASASFASTIKAHIPSANVPAASSGTPVWTSKDVGTLCLKCRRNVKENTFCGKTSYDCMC